MIKKSTFNKKLAAYSALAAAGIVSMGTVNAQVVYVDINPDVSITDGIDSLLLDLDSDSNVDFAFRDRFGHQANIFASAYSNYAIASNGFTGGFYYGIVLNQNDVIDPADIRFKMGQIVLASTWYSSTYGNFGDGVDHYVGLKFQIGTNYHAGWVRVNCGSTTGQPYLVKDYAYEATANTSILAGQTTSDVNEMPLAMLSVWSYNKQLNLNFGSLNFSNTFVKVFNTTGQLILTKEIEAQKTTINLESLASGLYMVEVTNNKESITRKISL